MKKSTVRKPKASGAEKTRTLAVKREALKDLTPQGQRVKAGGTMCMCTRSR